MKELIIKKSNNQMTLMDKEDIQNQINSSIASANASTVSLLVTYDDDTTETLYLKGFASYNGGGSSSGGSGSSSGGSGSSSGGSADSSGDDDD